MSEAQTAIYFLKKPDGTVYGPAPLEMLQTWAREGRVAPDDLLSKDQELWYPAPTLTDLGMNWLVHLSDGTQYGPIHLMALQELVKEGSLSPDELVTDRMTEKVYVLRDAFAAVLQEKGPSTLPEVAPPETVASKPESVITEQPQKGIDESAPTAPAISGAKTPLVATTPAQPSEEKAISTAPAGTPSHPSWRDLVARKDFLERELLKWKKLYEEEHQQTLRLTREIEERVQSLKTSELAALTRANQLERKLRESEENYRILKESLANDSAHPHVQQLVELTELYRDFYQRYEALASLLNEKNAQIAELLESRTQTEIRAQEQLRQMQEVLDRERHEADQARRRALEIEADYLQLVKSYRELNDRFMQLRQQAISSSSPTASATARRPGRT